MSHTCKKFWALAKTRTSPNFLFLRANLNAEFPQHSFESCNQSASHRLTAIVFVPNCNLLILVAGLNFVFLDAINSNLIVIGQSPALELELHACLYPEKLSRY